MCLNQDPLWDVSHSRLSSCRWQMLFVRQQWCWRGTIATRALESDAITSCPSIHWTIHLSLHTCGRAGLKPVEVHFVVHLLIKSSWDYWDAMILTQSLVPWPLQWDVPFDPFTRSHLVELLTHQKHVDSGKIHSYVKYKYKHLKILFCKWNQTI